MKCLRVILAALLFSVISAEAFSGDVNVRGYYRSDGTYVRPHVRSSPDSQIWNNYGPSQKPYELMRPRSRDYDRDGIPNYQDIDSDNDGIWDNIDTNPYGRPKK